MKYEYWITADLIGRHSKGTASNSFAFDRPLRPSDMNEVARMFRELPIVPSNTSVVVTSIFKFEGEPSDDGPGIPAHEISSLIESAENDSRIEKREIIERLKRLALDAWMSA